MSRAAKTAYIGMAVALGVCATFITAALVDYSSTVVLASFSTDLSARSPDQLHNIRRASAAIDGAVVKPETEFSFNAAVGLCGVARGYRQAPAIVDGEMRPSWGGGVCQVSSTLYNAALLAGLDVTERHAHSRRVSSVPPGRDATTAFGIADLRFVNTTGRPIRLRVSVSGSRLTASVIGAGRGQDQIEILTRSRPGARTRAPGSISGSYDASVEGTVVETYRVVRRHNIETRRELVSRDVYAAPAVTDAAFSEVE